MAVTRRRREKGFTLIELVIVLGVLGVLAALAIQGGSNYTMRAARTEATIGLSAIADAQEAFKADKERYAATFDELAFSFHGGTRVSPTTIIGNRYTYRLSQPAGAQSWYCSASANLDQDAWPDVLVMEQVP